MVCLLVPSYMIADTLDVIINEMHTIYFDNEREKTRGKKGSGQSAI